MDDIRNLDGISFTDWWFSKGGNRESLNRMWDPIAYALGFIDCDNISARCMLTIFNLFAVRSEASVLRMCEGSPNTYVHEPIVEYLKERGASFNLGERFTTSVGCVSGEWPGRAPHRFGRPASPQQTRC